jgi:hypothetical protein
MNMADLVKELRRRGFRVREGGWPKTLACEKRWDFCYHKRALFQINQSDSI